MRLLLLALVLLLFSGGPIAIPVGPQIGSVDVAATDADDLQAQASGALERLRQTQERRIAALSTL